jgi:CDP-diacylglycerol--glycerol-3-phosphate 3-phosphatidyltransferase
MWPVRLTAGAAATPTLRVCAAIVTPIHRSPAPPAPYAPAGRPERMVMVKQLARARVSAALEPVGRTLAGWGVSADVVTVLGTVGVVTGAVGFVARGHELAGTVIVALSVLTDMVDGAVARARGGGSRWGAFLDSTLDRVADAAIFVSLVYWLAGSAHRPLTALAAGLCAVGATVISYAKARAEGLGLRCDVGIAERTVRLLIGGTGTLLDSLGVPFALDLALWTLAGLCAVTVAQRLHTVWAQTRVS